jgi:enoyl-[acyl-carrier-protein] reductase (NADH)
MSASYSPEHRAAQAQRSPLGRIASAADIAGVACFLTTNAARYMTGEVVIVNGGAKLRLTTARGDPGNLAKE